MIVKKMPVGPIAANCFIVGCKKTKEAMVIDPGDETDRILMSLAEDKLTLKHIVNTHGHFDHVGGNRQLKEASKAPIWIHALDEPMLSHLSEAASAFGLSSDNSPKADHYLEDGIDIAVGELTFKVLHTPGHSPGGVSLFSEGIVFVGDTLFSGSIGRTDLPGGDFNTLISSIKNKLFPLGDDVKVCCGHGPETTIGNEKRFNPFLR